MRLLLIMSGFFFFVSCSDNADTAKEPLTKDPVTAEEQAPETSFTNSFPQLYDYFYSQDSSFRVDAFETGMISQKTDTGFLMDKKEFNQYKPYLLFNADSSFALDLVSYNYIPSVRKGKKTMDEQGPDFETAIIDVKNMVRTRFLFFRSSGAAILDAAWQDSGNVLIAGAIDWQNADSLRPVLWKYHVHEKTLQQFNYPNMISADWSNYKKKVYELNR